VAELAGEADREDPEETGSERAGPGHEEQPMAGSSDGGMTRSVWARAATATARTMTRFRADLPLAFIDALLVAGTYFVLFMVRFDFAPPARYWDEFRVFLAVAVVVTITANALWGAYGRTWEHASIEDARQLFLASFSAGVVLLLTFVWGEERVPLLVILTGPIVVMVLEGAVRFQSRLFALQRSGGNPEGGLRVAVVGGGHTGSAAIREMQRSPHSGLVPVVVVDDDRRLHHRRLLGVRVAGGIDDLPEIVRRHDVHQVLLAIPSGAAPVAERVADALRGTSVPIRVLPESSAWVQGSPSLRDVRDLRIEDLLDRSEVHLDLAPVRRLLEGKRVLITGAGGSIGSEIARQVAGFGPDRLVLLDHDETHLHDVVAEIPGRVEPVLADIRDPLLVTALFRRYRPEVVFHAAAHKHVPILEQFPTEAIRTNVLGTRNVVEAAATVDATHFVLISTDKAADPSSAMGASKWLAEQVLLAAAPELGTYRAVRFGNVMGSRGSVIPMFQRQIAAGGPVTVTDRRMTRWFMSIAEAVRLVLHAGAMDTDDRVLALRMGRQVNIYDLAERMIGLCGLRPGRDVEITITGMRPGEKLTESLVGPGEHLDDDHDDAILGIRIRRLESAEVEASVARLAQLAEHLDDVGAGKALLEVAAPPDAAAAAGPRRPAEPGAGP
jgi:FlaA1/EpsC-like NDP-sugar epimerase